MSCAVVSSSGLGEYLAGFPCPYDSLIDPGPALPALVQAAGIQGLGEYLPAALAFYPQNLQAKGLGCGCAGTDCGCGMGGLTMDGTGLLGTGLFSGGMDLSTWGVGEYVVAAFAVYAVFSLVSDVKSGATKVRKRLKRKKAAA